MPAVEARSAQFPAPPTRNSARAAARWSSTAQLRLRAGRGYLTRRAAIQSQGVALDLRRRGAAQAGSRQTQHDRVGHADGLRWVTAAPVQTLAVLHAMKGWAVLVVFTAERPAVVRAFGCLVVSHVADADQAATHEQVLRRLFGSSWTGLLLESAGRAVFARRRKGAALRIAQAARLAALATK